jgi:hypothetical protein
MRLGRSATNLIAANPIAPNPIAPNPIAPNPIDAPRKLPFDQFRAVQLYVVRAGFGDDPAAAGRG